MRNTFVCALEKAAEKDERIVLLTADMGYKLFNNFSNRFPGRFFNVGIAEANMISVAAGMAKEGLKPFVYSIAPFITLRCLEQIRNDLAYHNSNAIIVGVGAGLSYGFDGPSHFAVEDIAILRPIPNIKIICPGDPAEMESIVEYITNNDCGPIYLRTGKSDPLVHRDKVKFELGKGIMINDGSKIAIFSTGNMLDVAQQASEMLKLYSNICCRLISMPSVKPIDSDLIIETANHFEHIITIEEHSIMGGLGSIVSEYLANMRHHALLHKFALPDTVIEDVGDHDFLRSALHIDAKNIFSLINTIISRRF